jgi:hypothetical protein
MIAAYRSNGEAVLRPLDLLSAPGIRAPIFIDTDRAARRKPGLRACAALMAAAGQIDCRPRAVIKIFSMACMLWMAAIAAATVRKMNFTHMPEPEWMSGRWSSRLTTSVSAATPFSFFLRKGRL